MTKGITGKDPDPREVYADIIGHPHWESPVHPPMSLYDRAAQFAPFAALTGYEDMIDEEARQVDNKIELSEEELEELNRKLGRICEKIRAGDLPTATVTYFVPDPLKPGGIYETVTETIRRVDPVAGTIQADRKITAAGSRMEIRIGDILEIREESGSTIQPPETVTGLLAGEMPESMYSRMPSAPGFHPTGFPFPAGDGFS